ncbi:MAG: ComEC/Rec2 family competence protein [Ruminococcus sp.]|nr:ComEC/Rec2 family competence protein [Ruminococcus sp.]
MRRPLALIGLTTMLVLTVCFYADFYVVKWIFGLAFIGLLVTLAVKKLRKKPEFPAFFAVIMISVIGFTMFTELYVKPIQTEFDGENAEVTAVLLDEPQGSDNRCLYTVKTKSINNVEKSLRLSLYTNRNVHCQVGDTLTFTAELERADFGKYLADKIYLRAYTYEHIEVEEAEQRPFYYYIVKLRQSIRHSIYSVLDADTANLATAVLLGDGISDGEIYEDLRRSGLTHIVVVSGLHLSVITLLYTKSFGKRLKNRYINALITVLIVLFFLCLTGFGKSSIRAAIMLFVLIASKLFKREGDSLNSLGFAALLLCICNPYVVGDVGVLLSFSATFGIVVFSKPLYEFITKRLKPVRESYYKRINKRLRFFASSFATTFTAVMCTVPVNVLFFGKISLVQVFANLLVAPMIKWFMLLAAICAVPYYFSVPIFKDFVAFICNIIGKAILYVARFFSDFPMAYVKADYKFVILWIVAVITIFAVAYFIRRNGKGLHLICIVMSMLIFISGSLGHIIASRNKITVYVAPAKYGQSIVLSSKDGNVLLYSADDPYSVTCTEQILEGLYTEKQLMINSFENISEDESALFDYNEVLMYDNISENDFKVELWDKVILNIFERNGAVYQHISFNDTSVLVLPDFGDVNDVPQDMRSADVLITSGLIDNMELLNFKTLLSNGNDFRSAAVIDYFRNRSVNAAAVSDTVNFDIVG